MGFERSHLLPVVKKGQHIGKDALEDLRCSLICNSFCCSVVAWFFGQALSSIGILPKAPTMSQCWGELGDEEAEKLDTWGPSGGQDSQLDKEVMRHIVRAAMYRGSDVRLATGVLVSPGIWPRKALCTDRWQWKVVLSYKMEGQHINILELRAALSTFKWRMRSARHVNKRVAHVLDSQVCIAVIAKGRTSSEQLRKVLNRLNALVLASATTTLLLYVRTKDNPADAQSRWVRADPPQPWRAARR